MPAWPEREKDFPRSLGREGPRHPRLDLRARTVTPKPGQHPRGEETLGWAGGVGTSQGQGDRTPEALVPHTHTRVCTAHGTEPDFTQKDSQRSELSAVYPIQVPGGPRGRGRLAPGGKPQALGAELTRALGWPG